MTEVALEMVFHELKDLRKDIEPIRRITGSQLVPCNTLQVGTIHQSPNPHKTFLVVPSWSNTATPWELKYHQLLPRSLNYSPEHMQQLFALFQYGQKYTPPLLLMLIETFKYQKNI
ncbi:MAG: hypothetical protein PVG65_01215 [Candidatus Thorarchaeota archaeon]|jgi:hypothetical protein